jgi:hypothetical protein
MDGWNSLGIKIQVDTTVTPVKYHEGEITLLVAGRIFNLAEITRGLEVPDPLAGLIQLYLRYGMDYLLQAMDGTFTLFLLDQQVYKDDSVLYVVTDPLGVRPLYYEEVELSDKIPPYTMYGFTTDEDGDGDGDRGGRLLDRGRCYQFTRSNLINTYWQSAGETCYYTLPPNGGLGLLRGGWDPQGPLLAETIEIQLYTMMEKRVRSRWEGRQLIVCLMTVDDPETQMIHTLTEWTCQDSHIQVIRVDCGAGIAVESWVDRVMTAIQPYMEGEGDSAPPKVRVFVSSGALAADEVLKRDVRDVSGSSGGDIAYDASLRQVVTTLGALYLIPRVVTPFRKMGFDVEFPFMDVTWWNFYLSLAPQARCQFSLPNLVQEGEKMMETGAVDPTEGETDPSGYKDMVAS